MTYLVFAAAAVAVFVVGPRMARVADRLATATGMGGALFGLVFLALATDLPELALTIAAGVRGNPGIAVGSLLGAAAAQLALLAPVDIALRRRRVLRGVPLQSTVGQCAVMAGVLTVPLLFAARNPGFGWVSTATFAMLIAYVGGLLLLRRISPEAIMPGSDDDAGDEHDGPATSTGRLWLRFAGYAVVLGAAGTALERTTETIGTTLGLDDTAAGALLAGLVAPLPELVTAVSAARAGAIELAVGDLIGSSALDVALLALVDALDTTGSVFDRLGPHEHTLLGVSLTIVVLLLVGLARRDTAREGSVGFESWAMIGVYIVGVLVVGAIA